MLRKPRLDIPGLLQHVIVRGIERRKIFLDDVDRRRFVERFSSLLVEAEADCFAWALIPNHFHLLLRCNRIGLAGFMRRLLTGYAVTFNHRHRRCGHLFQNRYKSIVCEEDDYLLELIRYIHLNPLRAGLVPGLEELDGFPWCGHGVLMGRHELAGQAVDEVLGLFGKRLSSARKDYRRFVADGLVMGKRPELVGGGLRRSQTLSPGRNELEEYDDRVLGSGEFVGMLRREEELRDRLPSRLSPRELLERVGAFFDLPPESLLLRRKKTVESEARAVFCCLAVRMFRISGVEVGRLLSIGSPSVSRAVHRGGVILEERPEMKGRT